MKLDGIQVIAADRMTVWRALNDPDVLQASIPGCKQMEKTSPTNFEAVVVQKVGPVKATFNGLVELQDVVEGESLTLVGEGKGGVAGMAKGSARVVLADVSGGTEVTYTADASVAGRIAQLGSRLIDGVANRMANTFFENFKSSVENLGGADSNPLTGSSTEGSDISGGASAAVGAVAATGGAMAAAAASSMDAVENTAAGVIDSITGAASGAMDMAENAVDSVTGAVDGVAGAAGDAVSGVTDGITGAASGAMDMAENAVDSVTCAVDGAADAASDAVSGVTDGITGAASGAMDMAENAVDSVTGAVDGVAGAAGDAVSGVTGAAVAAVGGASALTAGAVSRAGDAAGDVKDTITGAVSDHASNVQMGSQGKPWYLWIILTLIVALILWLIFG